MGFISTLANHVFGLKGDKNPVSQSNVDFGKRKRDIVEDDEEDLLDFDASASVSSKNSLNSQPPLKRMKMDRHHGTHQGHHSKSPARRVINAVRSFFGRRITVEADEADVESDKIYDTMSQDPRQESGHVLSSPEDREADIETIDLVDDDDKENQEPLSATMSSAISSSTLSTLASFGGFTAKNFTSSGASSSAPATKPGPGHVILTQQEKMRRNMAMSPERVRAQFKTGQQSRYDKFFSEKDIVKRISSNSGIKKSKKFGTNAFKFTDQLCDRERYRQMLEKFGVIKYSALTGRQNFLKKGSGSSSSDKKPLVPSLDIIDRAEDKADNSLVVNDEPVTSTAIKHSEDDLTRVKSLDIVDLAASPVLGRDKLPSSSNSLKKISIIDIEDDDDDDVSAAIVEVTSPKYLEKLNNKYGAAAREREKQIQRELARREECQKDTEEVFHMIDKRLEQHLKITQAAVDETSKESEFDETQPTEMPAMTGEMQATIRRAQTSRGEVLIDQYKIQITIKDIDTLSGLNWLNDEVINFYMQMIVARAESNKENFRSVYAFNTFFYPRLMDKGYSMVKRWTKKVDLFSYSLVLIPVHLGMHWCLATVDMDRKSIVYYDSMGGNNRAAVQGLATYLQEEHKSKKGTELDMAPWKQVIAKKIPQQMNGSDCGMFTCKFAEFSSRRARFTFDQADMPYYRKRMVYEIVKNKLMFP